jgi:hypothetical protein
MDVVTALRDRMMDLSAVTALVSSRVYVQVLPQRPTLPAVRLQKIDEQQGMQFRGSIGVVRARVQVDAVSTTREASLEIDQAIAGTGDGTGLIGWRGTVASPSEEILAILPSNVTEQYDADDLNQFKVIRDYIVWYRQ